MLRTQIKKIGNSVGLLLTDEILKLLDICADDEVDITVEDRILIISPLNEKERKQKIDNAVQNAFKRRKAAYQRLAEGA
jgi:putative addiction module antidote